MLIVQDLQLHDISILMNYVHIQKVDISHNEISGILAMLHIFYLHYVRLTAIVETD